MSVSLLGRPKGEPVSILVAYVHGRTGDFALANRFALAASEDWEIFLDAVHWMDTGRVRSERIERLLREYGLA